MTVRTSTVEHEGESLKPRSRRVSQASGLFVEKAVLRLNKVCANVHADCENVKIISTSPREKVP